MGRPSGSRNKTQKVSAEQVAQMIRQYENGDGTEAVGIAFGLSASAVSYYLKREGVELRPAGFRVGKAHHAWKGGRVEHEGYIQVLIYPSDPYYAMAKVKSSSANGGRYVLEHRYKMAQKLGRCLTDNETVHHKDDNGLNNNLKNLQLRQGKHGKGASFRCCDCGSYNVTAQALAG